MKNNGCEGLFILSVCSAPCGRRGRSVVIHGTGMSLVFFISLTVFSVLFTAIYAI